MVSPPLLTRSNQLLFLCGANQSGGMPSARRAAIKQFIEGRLSSNIKVIYAENVFNELTKIGHSRNILDIEHEISDIADKIVIILESPSAFCELGAFSNQSLRKKLIVINDSAFKNESSFINRGPIAAAIEAESPVLWYPMTTNGIDTLDGIGTTFQDLKNFIEIPSSSRRIRLSGDISLLKANKACLYFVHDLVFFTGPVSHEEMIGILVVAFGKKNYDILKRLLSMLRAADLIRSFDAAGIWVYESVVRSPFLDYKANVDSLMATIRSFRLKNQPQRFEK